MSCGDLLVEVWSSTPLHKHLRITLSAGSEPAWINLQTLSGLAELPWLKDVVRCGFLMSGSGLRAKQEPTQTLSCCPVVRIPVHLLMQAVGCLAMRGR